MSDPDIALQRMDDQLEWYDKSAGSNERKFKRLKMCTLIFSVLIPLSAVAATRYAAVTAIFTAVLGATIAVLEGLQQLNQYHQNWITYRSTAEALKHEKFLYLSSAGQYSAVSNPKTLLAERVESLVSQEHSKWTSAQELPSKAKSTASTH